MARGKTNWTVESVQTESVSLAEALKQEFKVPVTGPVGLAIDSITSENLAQVREHWEKVDPKVRGEYADHLRNGAVFPPIVVTSSSEVIDGNTRLKAAVDLGMTNVPALIVDVKEYVTARMVGSWLNQRGGVRLTRKEVTDQARGFIEAGVPSEVIARRLGYSRTKIVTTMRAYDAEKRAQDHGIVLNGTGDEAKAAMADLTLDKAFLGAAALVVEAGLSSPKAKALAKTLKDAASEEEVDSILSAARLTYEGDIDAVASGAKSGRPNMLALGLGAIVKIDPDKWERPLDQDKVLAYRSQIDLALSVLGAIREKLV